MLWILFLGLTVLAWASYDVCYKFLGNEMNYFLALLIISIGQLLIAIPFLLYAFYSGNFNSSVKGYYISGLMGVLLAAGTIFFFYTFKYGAPLSVAMPVYGIGSLMIGVLAGVFIFHETISPTILAGLVLGAVSIVLLTVKL
ncbi:MAG: hypothetical protein WC349_04655 [Patescibacteria group bacterium]|jgi:drug/metabolite transporter (DMT)-like permease